MQINLLNLLQKKKNHPQKERLLDPQLKNLSPNLIFTRADYKQYLGLDVSLNKLSTTFVILSILIQLVLIVIIVINYYQNKHIQSLIKSLEPNISFLQENSKAAQDALILKAQLSQYEVASSSKLPLQPKIQDIVSALPKNVFLISLTSENVVDKNVNLTVQTPSSIDAARVLASYSKISDVKEIVLNSAILTNRETSTYIINFDVLYN